MLVYCDTETPEGFLFQIQPPLSISNTTGVKIFSCYNYWDWKYH